MSNGGPNFVGYTVYEKTRSQADYKGYHIERLIRRGGEGSVYEASNRRSRNMGHVAIKLAHDSMREVAEREFDVLGKMQHHPNVVTLLGGGEVGLYGAKPSDSYGSIMEFAEYGTVQQYIRNHDPDLDTRVQMVLQVADALQDLHESQRVVHKDVKLSNVLVASPGQAKLADFGAALPLGAANDTRTTAATAAPEQGIWGASVQPEMDVYGIGMLAGQLVSNVSYKRRQHSWDLPSFGEVLSAVGQSPTTTQSALEGVVRQCLQVDARDRFSTIEEFSSAFRTTYENAIRKGRTFSMSEVWPDGNHLGDTKPYTGAIADTEPLDKGWQQYQEPVVRAYDAAQDVPVAGTPYSPSWGRGPESPTPWSNVPNQPVPVNPGLTPQDVEQLGYGIARGVGEVIATNQKEVVQVFRRQQSEIATLNRTVEQLSRDMRQQNRAAKRMADSNGPGRTPERHRRHRGRRAAMGTLATLAAFTAIGLGASVYGEKHGDYRSLPEFWASKSPTNVKFYDYWPGKNKGFIRLDSGGVMYLPETDQVEQVPDGPNVYIVTTASGTQHKVNLYEVDNGDGYISAAEKKLAVKKLKKADIGIPKHADILDRFSMYDHDPSSK